jgi:hypothetical protein
MRDLTTMPRVSATLLSIYRASLELPASEREQCVLKEHAALFAALNGCTSLSKLPAITPTYAATHPTALTPAPLAASGLVVPPNLAAPSPASSSSRRK